MGNMLSSVKESFWVTSLYSKLHVHWLQTLNLTYTGQYVVSVWGLLRAGKKLLFGMVCIHYTTKSTKKGIGFAQH